MFFNRLKRSLKQGIVFTLCASLALGTVGCGKKNESGENLPDFVYVPESISIEKEIDFWNLKIKDNTMYVMQYGDYNQGDQTVSIEKYSFKEDLFESEGIIQLPSQKGASYSNFSVDAEGNIILTSAKYPENLDGEEYDDSKTTWMIQKYDSNGTLIFEKDITEEIKKSFSSAYIQNMAVDSQGRICMSCEKNIIVFDKDGNYKGKIDINAEWVDGMQTTEEGQILISYYSRDGRGNTVCELDLEKCSKGEEYKNFPSNSNGMLATLDADTYVVGGHDGVYTYNKKKQESEKIFSWVDCDIAADYVQKISALDQNTLLVFSQNWETNTREIIKLTKKAAKDVKKKKNIVIGALYEDYRLSEAVVNFNKKNEEYHITIKTYIDYENWSENSFQDAITNMNNDLISQNGPDIISMEGINVTELAKKGVFEDLTPLLEKSTRLNKTDYFDNMLEQCTFDGKLVTIPYSFTLDTVAGKCSDVGNNPGWTANDVIQLMEKNPDKKLLTYCSREVMLYFLMNYGMDAYIDMENGTCSFDTKEFKDVLELAKKFPSEEKIQSESTGPTGIEIAKGKLLLTNAYFSSFRDVQYCNGLFNDEPITFIGYPNSKGESGCMMTVSQAYGISSKSANKDVAWEFLESMLDTEMDVNRMSGFPSRKSAYEKLKADSMVVRYVTDPETGEVLKDEKGNPIEENTGCSIGEIGEDGEEWMYTLHIPTAQEVAVIDELINISKMKMFGMDQNIIDIITEEATPFFEGQKSVDEVINIIQSRISLYVLENK